VNTISLVPDGVVTGGPLAELHADAIDPYLGVLELTITPAGDRGLP
jgi:hypothetical protein